MEKSKRAISARTLILLFAAVILCALGLTGVINVTQAQLVAYSEEHRADIEQTHIGVALVEATGAEADAADPKWRVVNKGEAAGTDGLSLDSAEGKLLAQTDADSDELLLLGGDPQMIPGKAYDEMVSVRNSSGMDEYVRVTIYKYWSDGENKISPEALSPELIELDIADGEGDAWVRSEKESTAERDVYYLRTKLDANATAAPLVTGVKLSADVAKDDFVDKVRALGLKAASEDLEAASEDGASKALSVQVNLEARVDSVQTHSVRAAAKSAWGVDIAELNELGLEWE